MHIAKGIVTVGGDREKLALQPVIDVDGARRSVLEILIRECVDAGIREIAVVVPPGTESLYRTAAGSLGSYTTILPQVGPATYAGALLTARDFTADSPFLHLVGDHIFVSHTGRPCARQLVEVAEAQDCAVSGVQATRETNLGFFGAVGAHRVQNSDDLFEVERVVEKPTPTEAEQTLIVPGLRVGHYLCFFGMHVLTPRVFEILDTQPGSTISEALDRLAKEEKYLALQLQGARFPIDVGYGLLAAQLALGLAGQDREQVLSMVVDLVTQGELSRSRF